MRVQVEIFLKGRTWTNKGRQSSVCDLMLCLYFYSVLPPLIEASDQALDQYEAIFVFVQMQVADPFSGIYLVPITVKGLLRRNKTKVVCRKA